MICLDTNAIIAALNDRTSPVRARIDAAIRLKHPLAVSSIVLFELWYGAAKSARPDRNAQRIADFLAGPIDILAFEPADAEEAGYIRAALERAGTPIGPYDLLVAAQARRRDALLVTANEREFARVPRLKFEDGGCLNAICGSLRRPLLVDLNHRRAVEPCPAAWAPAATDDADGADASAGCSGSAVACSGPGY